jgi:hypothetical protein
VHFDPLRARDAELPDAALRRLDVLSVPGVGTPVSSSIVLTAGVTYRLRASGTWDIEGTAADAEYWNFDNGPPFDDSCDNFTDAGLAIDDVTINGPKQPRWGPYQPTHIYEIDHLGTGAALVANIHDDDLSNNGGALTLEIYGP